MTQTYGWAGHAEDSETYGTVEEVLSKVVFKWKAIIQNISVWVKPAELIEVPLEHLSGLKLHYPHACRSLVLSEILALKGKAIRSIFLYFGELESFSPYIKFEGSNLDCRRPIQEHSFYSRGDSIYLNKDNMSKTYAVEICQRQHVEEDPKNDCQNYPNKDFASYGDCDSQFVRNMLPSLMPVWITDDLSEVTTQLVDQNWTYGEFV